MKKTWLIIWLLGGLNLCISAQRKEAAAPAALIPLPVQSTWFADSFKMDANTSIHADKSLNHELNLLQSYIQSAAGFKPLTRGSDISLLIDTQLVKQPEGYLLSIQPAKVTLIAYNAAGIVHGIETMRQLWKQSSNSLILPGTSITDYPRFSYRGMHLDVSRHFFPVSFIKQFIDQLSIYKINNFHWHLTDDQGWRIEIKKYPKLQTIAAFRNQTLIGHKKELPHRFDGLKYGGYYTQEEIKEVVAYAAAKHIEVIPEIEMPGHASAALTAYPDLGCTKGPYKTAEFWGVFDDVFCAGNDSTFTFLKDVLDEVIELFPSTYIHIGGDECPKTRWHLCKACQQRIHDNNLANEDQLQSYFIRRIASYVNSKGRKIMGWDEILEGGLAPGATVMSWRGTAGAIEAAKQQQMVIMTPEDELYFDHYQSLYPEEKVAAGGYTPLSEVYAYEPLTATKDTALIPFIAGIQGQVWSEYLSTPGQAWYMITPRMQAMAERAWSPKEVRDYSSFTSRFKVLEIDTSLVFEEINYRIENLEKQKITVSLNSHSTNVIHYTIDGSVPDINSPVATTVIPLTQTCTLNALLFDRQQRPVHRVFQQLFSINKATGANIVLQHPPDTKFKGSATKLVNGVVGTHRYNDEQWLGFSKQSLIATIDLGSEQWINQVGINCLNYHWQRMWAPQYVLFEGSADGVHFQKLAKASKFPVNGINKILLAVKRTKLRYVRITAPPAGIIPAGEYGAGGNSMLLVDEIIIN
ncbi:beta-hexosaminidase [Chitinophaga silvatica]|uniref:beta-N-acetylhexosaminidase n=1 Tax=Chitinophaga silvatica TaxID=2282649 RepID=A0A3E1Y975_9BACT|nr:family 20 glycosylhydrolase [Chitinophaga silvatica]RFS21955.1 beta-hexosaminidase [Chitinophaga silvatica]